MSNNKPYKEKKKLSEMTQTEWEALCDRCGKCCLEKILFQESGELAFTNVACQLLDRRTCRCLHYENRTHYVKECKKISPENLKECYWLPKTCAYRLLSEGKKLPVWHPLITGTQKSVLKAGMSAAGRCVPPKPEDELQNHIVHWEDL